MKSLLYMKKLDEVPLRPIPDDLGIYANPLVHLARYEVMQIGSHLNSLLKDIGKRKKVWSLRPNYLICTKTYLCLAYIE